MVLSNFAYNIKFEDFSNEVIDLTKRFIVDYYSSCLAGFKVNLEFNKKMWRIIEKSAGQGEASVLFSQKKTDAINAAYMNAIYSHGADIDDGNREAMGHIATHIMSSVFSLAQEKKSTWKKVIEAIMVGYEIYNRLSAAAQPGMLHRGFHSTGTTGAIACGAACAKLIGLNQRGIYNAISIAAVQTSGLFVITESGQCNKPINPANAARVGLLSAKMSEEGIEGPQNALESTKGWFHAMTDKVHEEKIIEDLGTHFTISDSYLKPYPACRHIHGGIEAAIELGRKIRPKEIDHINIYTYYNAIMTTGKIKIPKTEAEAKFSMCYAVAVAFARGHFSFEDLQVEYIGDDILSIINRITILEDKNLENQIKGIRGTRIVVKTSDKKTHRKTIAVPKGEADNPFTWKDVREKLIWCGKDIINEADCDKLISSIMHIDFSANYKQPIIMEMIPNGQ